MKNTLVRVFVFALTLSGAVSVAHSKTTGHAVVASSSAFPVPMCKPSDPNACGID